jgi:hypothetical protein
VVVEISLRGEIRESFHRKGFCWCGSEPSGVMQTFVAPASIGVDVDGTIENDGLGTNTEILWNSSSVIQYKGLDVLQCVSGDHLYVTQSTYYKPEEYVGVAIARDAERAA